MPAESRAEGATGEALGSTATPASSDANGPEDARAPAGALGRVLDPGALEGPDVRTASLPITVSAPLVRGSILHVRAPKRLVCATCDGGGCSRCNNSGAFRVAPNAPITVPIASEIALPTRIRVAASRELGAGVDVVVLAIALGPASDAAWVEPPRAASLVAVGAPLHARRARPEVTIALVFCAVLFATIVAISATR